MVVLILAGEIPAFKLFESERILAFLDIQPLSKGHAVSFRANIMALLLFRLVWP